eukprot:Skav204818  [mRNA]  locus=scaffold3914:189206:192265:- [translate_table: standard]
MRKADLCSKTMAEACSVDGLGEKLTLKSSQGEVFEVEPEVACMSTLIKNMVEDSGTDEEIPLPNVKTAILSKAICSYHKDNPPEEIQKPLKSELQQHCILMYFVSLLESQVLFELILAANYLDIKSLLDLTCAKVASMIKGKNTEEIRKQFNIVNDFTPEEEAQVREDRSCHRPLLSSTSSVLPRYIAFNIFCAFAKLRSFCVRRIVGVKMLERT